jgi:nitrate reductase NapAB chaperone NapD
MPVFSYIAYPMNGEKEKLFNELSATKHCEVIQADKDEVIIIVTDTPDDTKEKELQIRLKSLTSLQSLSMTFGHTDE